MNPSLCFPIPSMQSSYSCSPKMPQNGDGREPPSYIAPHVAVKADIFRLGQLSRGQQESVVTTSRLGVAIENKLYQNRVSGRFFNFYSIFKMLCSTVFGLINFLSGATPTKSAKRSRLVRCEKIKVRECGEKNNST